MEIKCHFCSEEIPLEIYLEEGERQEFTIQCEACSHRLSIVAEWNEEEEQFDVEVDAG